jgi:hypothetical protein
MATGYFRQPEVVVHEGGHFLPTSAQVKLDYLSFLTQMRDSLPST